MATGKFIFLSTVRLLIIATVSLAGLAFSEEFHSYYQEYPIPDFNAGNSVVLMETDFTSPSGQPDWEGWASSDTTANAESFWQVSTYNADNLGGPGNHAWWCGRTFPWDCGTGDFNGYGNNWDTDLIWISPFPVPDYPFIVTVLADLNLDIQPEFDYLTLGYQSTLGFVPVESYTGSLVDYPVFQSFTISPSEIGDELSLVWRFESDGAISDEDCGRPSLGAAQIDNIQVEIDGMYASYEDNEGPTNEWMEYWRSGCGDFAKLWDQLDDVDASHGNYGNQLAFIDDGDVVPGTGGSLGMTWIYGPNGYVVNSTGGLCGPSGNINVEIWSPQVSLDAVPFDPFDVHLSFDVYRHESLTAESPGIFYYWRVRGLDSGGEPLGSWKSGPYYYGEPKYLRHHHDLTSLIAPGSENIQVALGVVELGYVWGWEGNDATPAPYFDNVSLTASQGDGLILEAEEADLAQDSFPAQGFLDYMELCSNFIRIDAARNVSPPGNLTNVPQDALVCRAASSGSQLIGPPELHYTVGANPLFDPCRFWPTIGSAVGDTVDGSDDRFAFYLPDEGLMYPGDVLHYYITVSTDQGASVTIPSDLSGYGVFPGDEYPRKYTMRGLPTIHSAVQGDQPEVLYWNDFGGRGEEAKWILALENLGYQPGEGYDLYYTNHPSSALGNGLGGRADAMTLEGYKTIMYSCGDLGVFTLSNGDFITDAGNDLAVLDAWIQIGGKNLLLTGSNLYFDLLHNAGPAGTAFAADWLGIELAGQDVRSLAPVVGSMPGVKVIPGNQIFWEIQEWAVGPGPSGDSLTWINAIESTGGAVHCAEFTDPGGNPGVSPYAAATVFERPEHQYRNVCLPYDLMNIVYPPAKQFPAIAARTRVLGEILNYFGNPPPGWPEGIPDVMECSAGRASPGVPVSVYTLPDGTGDPLDYCYAQGGSPVDATIWLQVRDGAGEPIAHYPAEDLWLTYTNNGQSSCGPVAASADHPTDDAGLTTFTGPFAWGGQMDPAGSELLSIVINNEMLLIAPFEIYYNSPDINGDLVVSLADIALFNQDLFGSYSYRSDFNWDGVINLVDVTQFQSELGRRCPVFGVVSRLPVTPRARMGIFFDESGASTCRVEVDPLSMVSAYICLLDPIDETGVLAWECNIDISGDAVLVEATPRGQYNDFQDSDGGFSVALATPLPSADVVVLADLQILYSGPGSADILLQPADPPPFTPPLPTYVTGDGDHVPVWPMSGNFTTPAAVINGECPGPGIAVSPESLDFVVAPDSTGFGTLILVDTGTIDEDISSLVWSVAGSLPDWLAVEPESGEIVSAGDSCSLSVEVDATGLLDGQHYSHALLIESNAGFAPVVATDVQLHVTDVSGVPEPALPVSFALRQCFPNPFNPQTTIAFDLPKQEMATLIVFDLSGRLVKNLITAKLHTPGHHEVVWNGRDDDGRQVASGTYFYRLEAGSFCETKRMILIK